MSYLAVIDIGGTFLKGGLVKDGCSTVEHVIRVPGPELVLTQEGRAEMSPTELLKYVNQLLKRLLDQAGSLEAILITGQMHGWMLTDHELQPLSPVVTWRDSLPVSNANEVKSAPEDLLRQQTSDSVWQSVGNELRSGIPVASFFARRERGELNVPGILHSLISYVSHALSGNAATPIMHSTDAAAHGFLNTQHQEWEQEILDLPFLNKIQLPEVVTDLRRVGVSSEAKCPVYVAIGDQQAALIGSSLKMDEISFNIATGSQVSKLTSVAEGPYQVRPYFGGLWLSTKTHIPAGRSLNSLVALVSELSMQSNDWVWSEIQDRLQEISTTNLRINLNFFGSDDESGSIAQITEGNLTVGHVFRAAVQQMVNTYYEIAHQLTDVSATSSIVLTGGLTTRFSPLKDAIADKFLNHQIREFQGEDASLQGLVNLFTS
jgi:xylulokinase